MIIDRKPADDAGEHREHQIERADVLVVGAEQPARHEPRRVVMIVVMIVVMAMVAVIVMIVVVCGC